MLINGKEGILSVGGTGAKAIDVAEQQMKDELDHLGAVERGEFRQDQEQESSENRAKSSKEEVLRRQTEWDADFQWSNVQGAEGWWQILMQGVWIDGNKVLQNQQVVIDVRYDPRILPC